MRGAWALTCCVLVTVLVGCRMGVDAGDRPIWTDQPELISQSGRFISAVGGVTPPGDEDTLTRRAEHAARNELGKRAADYVREAFAEFMRMPESHAAPDSALVTDFVDTVSASTSNAILRQSFRHDTWRDSRSGSIYVLYRIPVSVVNDRLIESARSALERANPFLPEDVEHVAERVRGMLNERLKAVVARKVVTPDPTPVEPEDDESEAQPRVEVEPEKLPPKWLVLGGHASYPEPEYLSATGVGDSEAVARENCRAELAARTSARMLARRVVIVAGKPDSPMARNLVATRPETLQFSPEDLIGWRVADGWHDALTNTYYVLGVVDRQGAALGWRTQLKAAFRDAREGLESGGNHHKADNHVQACRHYARALRGLEGALRRQLAALVVHPESAEETASMDAEGMLPQVRAGLDAVIGGISLEKISGDNQWIAPGAALREPLIVRAVAGRRALPVDRLPLRFSFTIGEGRLDEDVRTDEDGRAVCAVRKVARGGQGIGAVECALDLARVVGDPIPAGLTTPRVQFTFVTRTKGNTHLAFCLDERGIDGKPTEARTAQRLVMAALGQAQYNLFDSTEALQRARRFHITGDSSDEDVARAFVGLGRDLRGKGFLLVVVGKVVPALVDERKTSKGTLYLAHTEITLRVVDPNVPQNRTALEVKVVGKDAFVDDVAEAVQRSRVKAAEVCGRRLIGMLGERFGDR